MLLEFRVGNFRSFRDVSSLSLVASTDSALRTQNVFDTELRAIPGVLRTAALYGANASGKSNLMRGFALMRGIVRNSASGQLGLKINVQSFRLDREYESRPTEFEITCLIDGVRYQYGFVINTDRVLSEWLIVYKSSQPQTWFSRTFNTDSLREEYKFSSHFLGQRSLWEKSTRDNALFLSTAVQLNSEQLKPIFNYIAKDLVIISAASSSRMERTVSYISRNTSADIVRFLAAADTGITDIKLKSVKGLNHTFKFDMATGEAVNTKETTDLLVPVFTHTGRSGSATFDFNDESEGTQKLFALAGPLFNALRSGKVLIVDEMDRSLHTLLVKQLLRTFHNPTINRNGAQLVFTTHNTSILTSDVLRRDQIWFVEKDNEQASTLLPLTKFSARKDEAFERGYLSGKYGGVPILREMKVE